MIGWSAATNSLSTPGWVLFGIVFMWQMPHFLAIAWMYRDEYARAGIPLLPVIQPDGRSTGRQAVLYTAGLVPVTLMPTLIGLVSASYLAGAIVLGAILMALSLAFAVTRTNGSARRLFLGSILYLPMLWGLLVWDHVAR
jgi:protoheme IX farnesyltransferase